MQSDEVNCIEAAHASTNFGGKLNQGDTGLLHLTYLFTTIEQA